MDWKGGSPHPSGGREYPRSSKVEIRQCLVSTLLPLPPLRGFHPRNVHGRTGAGKGPGMAQACKGKSGLLSHKVANKILTHLYFPANAPGFFQI